MNKTREALRKKSEGVSLNCETKRKRTRVKEKKGAKRKQREWTVRRGTWLRGCPSSKNKRPGAKKEVKDVNKKRKGLKAKNKTTQSEKVIGVET